MQHEELDTLLAPISEELPAGDDLRFEGTYDRIQEARREDDASLPQGIWQTTLKKADWETVEREALAVLRDRSKDLQVAVWLLEARICLHGFAGLRSGLEVLGALCEAFWDDLYPRPEEGSFEYRLLPIEWMNEKLGRRLKRVPITSPADEDIHRYSWGDLEMARHLQTVAKKLPPSNGRKDDDDMAVTMEQFEASRMATPPGFYRALRADLAACMAGIDRFSAILRARCGNETPSMERLRVILLNIESFVSSMMEEGGVHEEEPIVAAVTAEDAPADAVAIPEEGAPEDVRERPAVPRERGELGSRSEAYAALAAIADYLMKIEPHSPTPYLIRRAVRWGSMPLTGLLQELMEEGNSLAAIYKLLGIDEPA